MITPQNILDFWFKELSPEMRFAKDPKLDQKICDRYSDIHRDASQGKLSQWRMSPQGRLAEIIILDQFSRNMFRDSRQSFAYDSQALDLAQVAVASGDDQKLPPEQRSFVYMPYMHSENPQIHERAISLFSQPGLEHNLKYEIMHKKIIDRFGRYPHRNKILGRPSTPEEIEFLKEDGSSF